LIRQREFVFRNRRRGVLLAALGALVLALSVEHSGLGHEDAMPGDGHGAVVSMCLAVVGAVTTMAGVAVARSRPAAWPPLVARGLAGPLLVEARAGGGRPRAGPPELLQVFRL
jgi:hypothetical protein